MASRAPRPADAFLRESLELTAGKGLVDTGRALAALSDTASDASLGSGTGSFGEEDEMIEGLWARVQELSLEHALRKCPQHQPLPCLWLMDASRGQWSRSQTRWARADCTPQSCRSWRRS